jgi:hypothetical protein
VSVPGSASAHEPAPEGWRVFQGSWSATGRRTTLPTEAGRPAAIVELSGAVAWTDDTGARSEFVGQAIGFDNGGSLSAGRAVWTDAQGNRIFSVLYADSLQTGQRIEGTITGGTGRYAGITGEYAFTWQYAISAADDVVQGRTVDFGGRFRPSERPR